LRHGRSRVARLALAVTSGVLLALGFAGVAFASQGTTGEAPKLDYTFEWWSFILSVALVIGFYIMLFVISEKEFKKVIEERFGPKR